VANRMRVIYSDLSEFVATRAEWSQVRDGILFLQIEEPPGQWETLHGHDWYYVCGDHAGCYTDPGDVDQATGLSAMLLRQNRHQRAGKLVDRDVWQRAKALMRQLPQANREIERPNGFVEGEVC